MPDLIPVDHDPFEGDSQVSSGNAPKLVPVDHDPFSPTSIVSNIQAAMPVGSLPYRAVKATKQELLGTASDMATLGPIRRLIDAAAEDAQHPLGEPGYVPQAIGPAAEVAMTLAGGAPIAAEKGAAGVFGGRLSKMADHEAIAKATEMEKAGVPSDVIWSKTGTARGADRQWRQEIDDSQAKLRIDPSELQPSKLDPDVISRSGDFYKSSYLDDVLNHPDLYAAYPHLRDVVVEPLPGKFKETGMRGQYSPSTNTIHLATDLTPEQALSTLLHEVQHAIQRKEGFAPGDNPANHIPAALGPARQQLETVRANTQAEIAKNFKTNELGVEYMKDLIRREKYGPEAAKHEISEPFQRAFQGILDKYPDVRHRLGNIVDSEKLISDAEEAAFEKYLRSMGEVEARNVPRRLGNNLSAIEPRMTEDTPRFLQRNTIDRRSNPIQESRSDPRGQEVFPPGFANKSAARIELNRVQRIIDKYSSLHAAQAEGGPLLTAAQRAEWSAALGAKQRTQQYLESTQGMPELIPVDHDPFALPGQTP